jgi:hypothetical protein
VRGRRGRRIIAILEGFRTDRTRPGYEPALATHEVFA